MHTTPPSDEDGIIFSQRVHWWVVCRLWIMGWRLGDSIVGEEWMNGGWLTGKENMYVKKWMQRWHMNRS